MFAETPLDGEGSYLYGGRWSSPGTRMAYASTSIALAMLEFLAHVEIDDDVDSHAPPDFVYVTAELPDADVVTLQTIGVDLPARWDSVPAIALTALLGDEWIAGHRSLALLVPSIHVPRDAGEWNVVINPEHERFVQVTWTIANLAYDRRLLAARAEAAKLR